MNFRVICPYCHRPAELVTGSRIYRHRPDLSHRRFWLCEPCDAYVGCHKNSPTHQPMGRLADANLRFWKRRAHAAFDPIWKSKQMTRPEAYAWLARELGISPANCHIGMFDVDGCKAAIYASHQFRNGTGAAA